MVLNQNRRKSCSEYSALVRFVRSKLIIRRTQNPASGFAAHNSQCEREVRSVLEMLSRFLQIVRGTGILDVSEKNVILLSSGKTQSDVVCRRNKNGKKKIKR
ncbi:hypothetical protein CDAR_527911 [Caerostris darwini]|uniref:Uncharacterized protein n=1 Tax=Caerostris darwini TaxID=1538125 RepID=A0AAV4QWJ5_9ARAC|nr:hypothetical protein CDAR_527911 [Caerostris darwini]